MNIRMTLRIANLLFEFQTTKFLSDIYIMASAAPTVFYPQRAVGEVKTRFYEKLRARPEDLLRCFGQCAANAFPACLKRKVPSRILQPQFI